MGDSRCQIRNRSVGLETKHLVDTLWLNGSTYFTMYPRKALLNHLPIIMIVHIVHPPKYTVIVAPDLSEYVPILSFLLPNKSSPIKTIATLRASASSAEGMGYTMSYLHIIDPGMSNVAPAYPHILHTTTVHW